MPSDAVKKNKSSRCLEHLRVCKEFRGQVPEAPAKKRKVTNDDHQGPSFRHSQTGRNGEPERSWLWLERSDSYYIASIASIASSHSVIGPFDGTVTAHSCA